MGFIKELYYGNISNEVQKIAPGSEYQRLSASCTALHEELRHKLDKADAKKLDKLTDDNFALTALTAEENYALGFRDGAKMMIDILTGENKNLYY